MRVIIRENEAGFVTKNGTEVKGTLYPVLTRLDKNGFISCRRGKSPLGPVRKYYTITESGKERLEGFKKNYRKITESTNKVLFEESTQKGEKE